MSDPIQDAAAEIMGILARHYSEPRSRGELDADWNTIGDTIFQSLREGAKWEPSDPVPAPDCSEIEAERDRLVAILIQIRDLATS